MGYATRFEGDGSFQLGEIDPSEDAGLDESEAERRLAELTAELRELQELMFAFTLVQLRVMRGEVEY